MKKVPSLVLATLIAASITHLNAEDSVDQQIAAIQKAPAAERVQLMNQFKSNLANMNEADQIKAMNRLQKQLQVRAHTGTAEGSDTSKEMQMRMQEMHQIQQMNQMQQNMGQVQNINAGRMQGGRH